MGLALALAGIGLPMVLSCAHRAAWVLGSAGVAVRCVLPAGAWLLLWHWLPASAGVGRLPAPPCRALLAPSTQTGPWHPQHPDRPPLFLSSRSLQPSPHGVWHSRLIVPGPGGWSWAPGARYGHLAWVTLRDRAGVGGGSWPSCVCCGKLSWRGGSVAMAPPPTLPWGSRSWWCRSCSVLGV